MREKRELVRVVRTPDGRVVIDPTGRQAGRGAYLCADGACWATAIKKRALERALDVRLPDGLREELAAGPERTPTHTITGGGARGQE